MHLRDGPLALSRPEVTRSEIGNENTWAMLEDGNTREPFSQRIERCPKLAKELSALGQDQRGSAFRMAIKPHGLAARWRLAVSPRDLRGEAVVAPGTACDGREARPKAPPHFRGFRRGPIALVGESSDFRGFEP